MLAPADFRRFLLRWNQSKTKTASQSKHTWHECYGCRYPNGRVTLDFGPPYASISELEYQLEMSGSYHVDWIDN